MKLFFKKFNKSSRGFPSSRAWRCFGPSQNVLCASPSLTAGFTLVETLVAISIFTVSLLGIMSILAGSISSTGYAKQKILASYLAQEGIEYVRNMRDTNVLYVASPAAGWSNFKSEIQQCLAPNVCKFDTVFPYSVSACADPVDCKLYINSEGGYDTTPNLNDSGFIRKIWVDSPMNADDVKVNSSVSWTQGSGTHDVTFSESLFNWVE